MTDRSRLARKLLEAVFAIVAGFISLTILAVCLLERMIYYPGPNDQCARVGSYLLHGRRAIGPAAEGIPAHIVNGCAAAAAPYEVLTAIVFWAVAAFDALALIAILVMLVLRYRLVSAVRAEEAARTGIVRPRRRISALAWVGLGLSVAAIAGLVLTADAFNSSLEFAGRAHEPLVGKLFPLIILATTADFIVSIAVCTIAGTKGFPSRLIGILGGLIMISPIVWICVSELVTQIVDGY